MDRGHTKQEILEASLDLFSVQGFEATSISQIASAVGIRKASLYSHFESKQAIPWQCGTRGVDAKNAVKDICTAIFIRATQSAASIPMIS